MSPTAIRLGNILEERDTRDCTDETVLSVYRDHGVVPKTSRSDNFNKTPQDVSAYKLVLPSDVVVNKMKGWQGSVAVSGHRGIVSGDYLVSEVARADLVEPGYLHYALRSSVVISEIRRLSTGIRPSQWRIYWDEFRNIEIVLPSVEEQRRIAALLDAETNRIDQLAATKTRMIDLLAERQQAVIDDAFGCRSINRRWDGVPVSPGEGCSTARLGALASINGGVTVDSSRVAEDEVELSYLRVANVQDGSLDLSDVKTIVLERRAVDRFLLRPGDVLMTEGGDPDKLGRGAVWQGQIDPCVTQNHVFFVRPDPNVLSSDYLSLLSQTSYARAYFETTASKTTGIASTSSSKIAAFRVPVPSWRSQRQIVDAARRSLTAIDQAESTIRVQIDLLHERRRSLVTAAVTGQMGVP